ncbi:MAG: DNA-directed polymerase, partial [Jatrophihabitantaceae bacterium]|nr:DNA-directed polymerase [Jatrophihabitantaceae bacterium]
DDDGDQLELPLGLFAGSTLDAAVDGIQARFGRSAMTRGVLLGRASGLEMPTLPDPGRPAIDPRRQAPRLSSSSSTDGSCAPETP